MSYGVIFYEGLTSLSERCLIKVLCARTRLTVQTRRSERCVLCNLKSQSRRLERLLPDVVKSMQRSILHFILYLDWSQWASWNPVLCHRIVFRWSLSTRQTNHLKMWGFGNLSSFTDLHRNHLGLLAGFSAVFPRIFSLAREKCNHHFLEALSERLIAVLKAIPLMKWIPG